MNKLTVKISENQKQYDIIVGKDLLKDASKYFNLNRNVLIVTDDNIPIKYIDNVKSQINSCQVLTIPHGEENKSIENYQTIIKTLIDNHFTRKDAIVAIGGGVIGDMAAFAASTYMRGIDFYNIPTTLLSQVDSSIGGKTAIDFMGVKNIVGSFYQPKGVLIDTDTLLSLPKKELNAGFVESVKMAATFDKDFFNFLLDCNDILDNVEKIVISSLAIKKDVVEKDEKESGLRKVLNFGHTIGHGIEEGTNLSLLHGECIGIGMLYFSSEEANSSIKNILAKHNLPTSCDFDKDKVLELIKHDKKSNSDTISIIYVDKIGTYEIKNLTIDEIKNILWNTV